MTRLLAILTVFMGAFPVLANGPINTQWQRLCSVTGDRQISIYTSDGRTVQGKCRYTDATTLHLNQGPGQLNTIERSSIKQIVMDAANRNHHFLKLRKTMREHLLWEASGLATPCAPLALAAMPLTIAAGAVASPFALLFDLFEGTSEGSVVIVAL